MSNTRRTPDVTIPLPLGWAPSFPASTLPKVRERHPRTAESLAVTQPLSVVR